MRIYRPTPGTVIDQAAAKAANMAREEGDDVVLEFNDIGIIVSADSSPRDIATIYWLKGEIQGLKKGQVVS